MLSLLKEHSPSGALWPAVAVQFTHADAFLIQCMFIDNTSVSVKASMGMLIFSQPMFSCRVLFDSVLAVM